MASAYVAGDRDPETWRRQAMRAYQDWKRYIDQHGEDDESERMFERFTYIRDECGRLDEPRDEVRPSDGQTRPPW